MVVVRYAPSPTGRLHVGNARPALWNWLFAKRHAGRFILRFDDTDAARSTREYADAIEEDLSWLGIVPDLVVRQSERLGLYAAARDRLVAAGRLYPCYETPDELDRKRARARALGRPPVYDRAALDLTAEDRAGLEAGGRRPHWRFRLDGRVVEFDDLVRGPQRVDTASMSDPVLVREDGSYLYTLPSVVDDIDLRVTHVIRGEDHVSNTGVQIELFEALGAAPPAFAHHNLLTGAEGEGLSKRLGSLSIAELRAAGYEALAVATVALATGTSAAIEPHDSLDTLIESLDFPMISHGPARFDPADLDALNARLVHGMSFAEARDRLDAYGVTGEAAWLAVRENVSLLPQVAAWAPMLAGEVTPVIAEADREFLATARELLPPEPWDETTWGIWTGAIKATTGRKGRALFLPLRLALTGRPEGPELRALLPLFGRRACLDRLPAPAGRRTG